MMLPLFFFCALFFAFSQEATAADYQTGKPCNTSVEVSQDPTVKYREPVDASVPPATMNDWSHDSNLNMHFPIEIAPGDLQSGAGGADRLSNPGIAVGGVSIYEDQADVSVLGKPSPHITEDKCPQ